MESNTGDKSIVPQLGGKCYMRGDDDSNTIVYLRFLHDMHNCKAPVLVAKETDASPAILTDTMHVSGIGRNGKVITAYGSDGIKHDYQQIPSEDFEIALFQLFRSVCRMAEIGR